MGNYFIFSCNNLINLVLSILQTAFVLEKLNNQLHN
jgi:hypothetical protein